MRETSLGEMLRNVWTLNDLATSCLFVIVIIIKIYYVSSYPTSGPFECPAADNGTAYAHLMVRTSHKIICNYQSM